MAGTGAAQGPSPQECAQGGADPVTLGAQPGQLVVCAGAAGHTIAYAGGDATIPCGAVIVGDRPVLGDRVTDPNSCNEPVEVGHGTRGRWYQPAVQSRHGVVAAGSGDAARAGARALERGGNAVDAAVTAAFAQGVTRPDMCGIGGAGYMVYRSAAGVTRALDFQGRMPAASHAAMFDGRGLHEIASGHRMTAVPGLVAGLDEALRRLGTITLAEAIAPAERLARRGFIVSEALERSYSMQRWLDAPLPQGIPYFESARLRTHPEAARVYLPGGAPPTAGSRLRLPDYARSLRRIARDGRDAFYRGEIADLIVAEMERSQSTALEHDRGLITRADLSEYEAVWRKPLKGTYRGAQVVSAPPPSAGGIFVLQVLNLLERFDVVRHSSADRLHLLAEAQKLAWADRAAYVGDPEFVGVPADELTSKSYADRRRVLIDMARAGNPGPGTVRGSQPASPGQSRRSGNYTIHLSVIDAAGNAVALTCSLGDPFGNTVVPAGSGLLLNTQITSGETLDPLAPRRRARTSMTPTIVAQGGEPILAVGGAGSKKIPMGVLQAIVNVIDHDMDVARALDAARLSEPQCCTMELESARVLPDVIAELGRRGHEVAAVGEYAPLPILAAAGVDRASGDRLAADDPRGQFAPVAARRPPSG